MPSRIALVTGASSGIGHATALALRADGYEVFAGARKDDDLRRLASEGLRPLQLDVRDENSMQRAVKKAETETGHIDLLVNNAGYGQMGVIEEVSLDQWRQQFEVNVFGLVRMAQLVLPAMRRHGSGRIVNIGSMGGEFTYPLAGAYHATKYAVEAISDALRFEVAPFGIKVVLVQPGVVDTPLAHGTLASIATTNDSAYAGMIQAFTADPEAAMARGSALLKPEKVAAAIVEAVQVQPAPTRLKIGPMAEQMVATRRAMADRDWDAMLAPLFGLTRKQEA